MYNYVKITAEDGTVSWTWIEGVVKGTDFEIQIDGTRSVIDKRSIKGAIDLNEVWSESGGRGTHYQVTSIGNLAFKGWWGLKSIIIPSTVIDIRKSAFDRTGLTSIVVEPDNPIYDSRNNCNAIIEKATNTLIFGCRNSIIPESVTTIGDEAFRSCPGLTSISIPTSVNSIGEAAFSDCSDLTSIVVESGNSVYDSRNNCNAIIEKATNTLIAGCRNTFIPESVTTIGDWAFEGCRGLTNIIIPESVTTIGDWAFESCWGLTSINIPKSVTTIGDHAFRSCNNAKSISIAEGVTSIGDWAFDSCSELRSINIPEGVTSIGDNAFSCCFELRSISIPSSVTSIGEGAFGSCSNLIRVSIAEGVTSIGDDAFHWCHELTSINIPNSVTSIGDNAFEGCSKLKSINIPNSITSIGEGAFFGCEGLTSVTSYITDVFAIETHVFEGCENATLYVPKGLVNIYQSAEGWNTIRNIKEIPIDLSM